MNPEYLIFFAIILGVGFASDLVTLGYKKHSEEELLAISNQYAGIKWKYWGWSVLLLPLMLVTIFVGFAIAPRFPSIEVGVRFFSGAVAIAYLSLYQAAFALRTGVYPVGKYESFVIANDEKIRALAVRGMIVVILLLSLALAYVIVLSVLANIRR